jgi:acetylornithine deacetylase/succinyl-diaminopimelate desuccinylase family protein
MGKPAPDEPPYYEHRVTDYLESLLKNWGLPTERTEVHPGRDNLLTRLDGVSSQNKRPLILFEVHQDTVPVEGMEVSPFGGEIQEGKLYGRGACDVKGGMTAMLAALVLLMDAPQRSCDLAIAFTINEEFGFTGATKLVETWSSGQSRLLPRAPDAIIVAEPTMLDVVIAHKGVVRWRCTALGRAGHSSQPQRGQNAIYAMARAISAFEEVAHSLTSATAHPLLGQPSLNVGTITGGVSVNTVPDRCTIEIDRRLLPHESPQDVYQSIVASVAGKMGAGDRLEHAAPFITSRGLSNTRNAGLAKALGDLARAQSSAGKLIGVPFGTDAASFDAAEVPVVVFGPGDIAQAHTADEWIELSQIDEAAEILKQFCLNFQS